MRTGYGFSAYAIDGFEPPAAPISSEDDESFTSAIDFVQSHLSSDGAFYVAFDVGSQISATNSILWITTTRKDI